MAGTAATVVPFFRIHTIYNEAQSKKQNRPVFDEMEVCELRFAANKQTVAAFPAHDLDPEATRERGEPVTYAMRYNKQYQDFKNKTTQSVAGTPLEELTFLTQGKRMELKALNIHTAEALAALDGRPLKQLGPGGRELKNKAQAYLDQAAGSADVVALASRIAELEQQLRERDEAIARVPAGPQPVEQPEAEEDENQGDDEGLDGDRAAREKELEDLTDAELKDFIKRETGEPVKGNPSRQTLIDRAMEIATSEG